MLNLMLNLVVLVSQDNFVRCIDLVGIEYMVESIEFPSIDLWLGEMKGRK